MNDRWNYTDKKLKEIFKKYNKLNKRTQDKLQDVFNNFNFTYQEIFKYASMKNLRKVNRIIEELKENNLINDYYGKSLLNKIYKKIRVKNSLILEFMIYMCFLEERKKLDEYENLMFNDLMNTEYQKAQKEVYSLKNDSRKPIALTDTFLLLLLGMPNPKGYVWTNYIDASLLYNSNQIYRQALINLQQNKFLDIESDSFQNILRKQRNTYLSIHDGIISGDLELQTTFLVNNSIKEGYLEADPDAKVRFIAEMDKKTTKMCDTLNNQIFKLNDWNTYQRYSEEDKRIITYKTFGLEVGANLPPINNHFHWCRSTITYNIDNKYNYNSRLKAKYLSKSEMNALMNYISSDSYKINNLLYTNSEINEEWGNFIYELDNALSKMPKYNGIVYRSLEIENQEQLDSILSIFNNKYEIGKWNSYISSSLDIYDNSFNLQFKIKSKNGRNLTALNGEGSGEVLFMRNTEFKLVKISHKYGKILVDLEEV